MNEDPVRARRAQIARWVDVGKRVGYLALLVAIVGFFAGLALDIHLVAGAVTGDRALAIALGAVVFAMFIALWFAFPQWRAARARLRKR